jgi:UDP-N-acetyl-D-mannosaminuronic acid dehydrogenase
MSNYKVCVIGLGYIGLPTSVILAENGNRVYGVDVNAKVVEMVNKGEVHIVEPELDVYLKRAVVSGQLTAHVTAQLSDVYIICVPTPFHEGQAIPQPNLDYVFEATRNISTVLKAGDLIILESTSPVGTTLAISALLEELGVDITLIDIAYCPERVLPGKTMRELVENDRVVGGISERSTKAASQFYRLFVRGAILETNAKTAELCKLAENSFRDVNIAFANELSLICSKEKINVAELIKLANHHPRVSILQPGPGVGGHCIAVDPWFIVAIDPENSRLIQCARKVNDDKTQWVIEQIKKTIYSLRIELGRTPKVAFLGLAFKPDIDDLRGSPSVTIASNLISDGNYIIGVEPNIKNHPSIPIVNLEDALASADLFISLVKHNEFVVAHTEGKIKNIRLLDFCGLVS